MDKLLIADDEADIVSMLTSFFEGKGYEVMTASDGIETLKQVEKRPDLILLDIQMAPKNGIETLREIREMEKCQGIPVIMLTSQSEKQTIVESSKLGINDYVLKPFKTQDLHDRIERVLKEEIDKRLENR